MPIFVAGARVAATIASPAGPRGRLCILFYHRVLAQPDPLQPEIPDAVQFDRQMAVLARVFRVLPLEDAVERLAARQLPSRALCVTFDDGYRDNLDIAYPILRRHGLTATFYIASGALDGGRMFHDTIVESVRRCETDTLDLQWLGLGRCSVSDLPSRRLLLERLIGAVKYLPDTQRAQACTRLQEAVGAALPNDLMMRSEHVRLLARAGMSIGGHTVNHFMLSGLPADQAACEIDDNRAALTRLLGSAPSSFAYPNGKPGIDYGTEHMDIVRSAGYHSAVSTAWGVAQSGADLLQLPRISAAALPPRHLAMRILRAVALPVEVDRVEAAPTHPAPMAA